MALLDLERGRAQTVWNKLWRQKVDWQDGTVEIPADNDDYPWADPVVASHHSYAFVDVRVLVETLALSDYGNPSEPAYLVFRTEYLTLLEALISSRLSKVHNLVITGQPGIGKSFFLLFLLVFRLERGLPTAFQYHSTHYFLFDDAGGTAFYATYHHQRLAPCWALTDSNEEVVTPGSALKNHARRNILSASLKTEKWDQWLKHVDGEYVVMDLPSMQEIIAVMHVRCVLPNETLKIVRKWGPSLRVVRFLAEDPKRETMLLDRAKEAAVALLEKPRILSLGNSSVLTSVGSTLVFVRPRRRAPNFTITAAASLFIPTRFLYGVLEKERTSASNKHALQLFLFLSKHSLTRSATGWAHEQNVHTRLTTGNTALTIFRGSVKQEMLPSSNLLPCTLAALNGVCSTDSFYWLPAVTNFPGVDGVLGDGKGNLYAIQATLANKRRSPVDGLQLLWTKVNAAVRHDLSWHLVIVTPDRPSARKQVADFSVKLRRFQLGNSCQVTVWGCGLSCQW